MSEIAKYEEYDWQDLPQPISEALMVLGYTKRHWDKDKEPDICQKAWSGLTASQKDAARKLGYNQVSWDEDSDSDSSWSQSLFFSENVAKHVEE